MGSPSENRKRRWRRRHLVELAVAVAAAVAAVTAFAGVSADPYIAYPGDTVSITGDEMTPGENVRVDVNYPDGTNAQSNVVVADAEGRFSDAYTIKQDDPGGIYDVIATGEESGNVFTTTFDPPNYGAAFAATPISPTTVDYSDLVTFSGTFTCTDAPGGAGNLCPTSSFTPTVTIQLKGTGIGDGNTWTDVEAETVSSFQFTTSTPGCPSATPCSVAWSVIWQAGRLIDGTTAVPPGSYNVRGSVSGLGAAGINLAPSGLGASALTLVKEDTYTTYNGAITGGTSTAMSVSALVADEECCTGIGLPVFLPDTNLAGTDVVDFTLYSNVGMTTAVAGATTDASIDSAGATTGTPTVTLPATPGTYYMKTTYAGNTYYDGSFDGPDNIEVTTTVIQVCKAAPAIAAEYLKTLNPPVKAGSKQYENIISLIAGDMANAKQARFPAYSNGSENPASDTTNTANLALLPVCGTSTQLAAYKTAVEKRTLYLKNNRVTK